MPSTCADLYVGDCRDLLPYLSDGTVDAVVTDPPYELTSRKSGSSGGFMGQAWDATGVAFDEGVWRECFRVLKPGGHALVFGGTRTFHRVAVALEDAGFEIRDTVSWTYASGMPKSHNLERAAEKAGVDSTPYRGWGSALKPAWEPILVARKPLEGTLLANATAYGVGGFNIDATRIGSGSTAGAWVPGPVSGRWPANIILGHSPDCRVVGEQVEEVVTNRFTQGAFPFGGAVGEDYVSDARQVGSPVYDCVAGCPVALMNLQSGEVGAAAPASGPTFTGASDRSAMSGSFSGMGDREPQFHADSGGAGRFFYQSTWGTVDLPPFLYCAKAPKRERVVVDGETHPTQKPLTLMRWLTRLVTPPGGVVLDPFAGSGTTLEAAVTEGFSTVGIELTLQYVPLIAARLERSGVNLHLLDGTPN